jgi:hypothetical protein
VREIVCADLWGGRVSPAEGTTRQTEAHETPDEASQEQAQPTFGEHVADIAQQVPPALPLPPVDPLSLQRFATAARMGHVDPRMLAQLHGHFGNARVQSVLRKTEVINSETEQSSVPVAPLIQRLEVREEYEPDAGGSLPYAKNESAPRGDDHGADPPGQQQAVEGPSIEFLDLGRVGTVRVGDAPQPGEEGCPSAFVAGGRTGSVRWAGGGGAGPHGNQRVGTLQKYIPPVYKAKSRGLLSDSDAWVKAGTGVITVIRSWVGATGGDQGNTWWISDLAAARLSSHEQLHVKASKRHYDALLAPLLASVATSRDLGREAGFTEEDAVNSLRFQISWPMWVTLFQVNDIASNDNGGEVDSGDLASGTYPVQIGPGIVLGKFFNNRLRMPSEPNPPIKDPDAPDEAMEMPGMTIGRDESEEAVPRGSDPTAGPNHETSPAPGRPLSMQAARGNQYMQRLLKGRAQRPGRQGDHEGDSAARQAPPPLRRQKRREPQTSVRPARSPAPAIQRYPVGLREDAKSEALFNWLNNNSPYEGAWARTDYKFSRNKAVSATPTDNEGEYLVTVNDPTVELELSVDMPTWQTKSESMQKAWDTMYAELRAHEKQHEDLAKEWKTSLSEYLAGHEEYVNADSAEQAKALGAPKIEAAWQLWLGEHDALQKALDPFYSTLPRPKPEEEEEEGKE